MILFNSIFPVDQALNKDVFLQMVRDWLFQNQNYGFEELPEQLILKDGVLELFGTKDATLQIYETDSQLGVQLDNHEQDCIYRLTYILTEYRKQPVLFVRLEHMNTVATSRSVPRESVHVPALVRNIMWDELGGHDNGLVISDKAMMLRKSDVSLCKDVLTSKGKYMSPIVYVTPMLSNGLYMVNYDRLATELMGQACVLVEASPVVSKMIATDCTDKPMDGDIQIILPSGETKMVKRPNNKRVSSAEISRMIQAFVVKAVHDVAVTEQFSFDRVKMNNLLAHNKDDELMGLYESMMKSMEEDNRQLREALEEAEQNLYQSKSEAEHFRSLFEQSRENRTGDTVISCSEKELYPNEFLDVILKVLEKERNTMSSDPNMLGSRKYHVISSILDNTDMSDIPKEIRKVFSDVVVKKGVSPESLKILEKYGFQYEKSGSGHYKLIYQGDSRYQTVLSNTPSDYRGGQNAVSEYMSMLFGY